MRKRIFFWWVLTNIIYNFFLINCDKNLSIISGAWLEGGGGGGSTLTFIKNWRKKNVLVLEKKNALIVVIYGLNFSFTMQLLGENFLGVFRRKSRIFFPTEPFFLVLYMIIYQSNLILKKLPCPKIFLVTRLNLSVENYLILK